MISICGPPMFAWIYGIWILATCSSFANASSAVQSNTSLTPTTTIEFSSAVVVASSVSIQSAQLASIPAVPLPSNISNYDQLSHLAALLPPLQKTSSGSDTTMLIKEASKDFAKYSRATEDSVRRQADMRVMIVGDSMTQGAEGDWTWRYRIWEWFQSQGIAVDFVGPYVGTQEPDLPKAPSPPPLYGVTQAPGPIKSSGGYAVGVSADFGSDHFSVWGRAAAVDKGLIQDVVTTHEADLMLLMLGFNDLGWFYSDAHGTLDSIQTIISNARAANPNLKFAIANIPQRTLIGGREDLPLNTDIYNSLLSNAIPDWSTTQSPISLVKLQENYECGTSGCPAGYDGLHPNALGEYQIARAFTLSLIADFNIGHSALDLPDNIPARPLPAPSNFQLSSSPGGVTGTWGAVYGAHNYDVQSRIQGITDFTTSMVSTNRWDAKWPVHDFIYDVQVRASAGDSIKGDWTTVLSATAHPITAPGPANVVVQATSSGFVISWDPPTGAYTDSIIEYNIIYWDKDAGCAYIDGAAFTQSPAQIDGLNPGHRYLVAPVTWNSAGEGFPEVVHTVTIGAGTPTPPSALNIISTDATTIHMTWEGSSGAGGYQIWSRNVNNASSVPTKAGSTDETCFDSNWLFPGTWNYEWCISAYNGNAESAIGPCQVAPQPSDNATPLTCPLGPAWCPDGPTSTNLPGSSPTKTPTGTSTNPPGSGPTGTSTGTSVPTGSSLPGPVTTNGQCIGPDCNNGECTGLLCVSLGCTGSGCFDGVCTGPSCTVLGCIGSGCSNGVCTNNDCITQGCMGSQCGSNGQCDGSDCVSIGCSGTDCGPNGVCKGPDCFEQSCTGPDCVNGSCWDSDCTSLNGCTGSDCSNGECGGSDCSSCAGSDCHDGSCAGDNCIGCSGSDCHNGQCTGSDCHDCTGSDCHNGECTGPHCSSCIGSDCDCRRGKCGCKGSDCTACFGLGCVCIGLGCACNSPTCTACIGLNCDCTGAACGCSGPQCSSCDGSGCSCSGAHCEGGQNDNNPSSTSCAFTATVTDCGVGCSVTAYSDVSYVTACYTTACSTVETCGEVLGTTSTSVTTTAVCPLTEEPISTWTPSDPDAPPLTLGADNKYSPSGSVITSTSVHPPTSSVNTSTTPVSTSTTQPTPTALPDLIFCYSSNPVKGVWKYGWFANNGSLTCSKATADDWIAQISVPDDERTSDYKYPYQYTKMGDLTKVYPDFYDCQFLTAYDGKSSDDAAYGSANQGDEVGLIGCNDQPTDATTVDAFYGFCHKLYDVMNTSGGVVETLFRCIMANPRG